MKKSLLLCAALTLCLSFPAILRADPLDDELAAIKTLLVAGKDDQAAQRLDALEARARVTTSATPTDAHANYILGMAAMYAGHDAAALTGLDLATRLEPKNPVYALGRGQLALYQDKPKDAVALLEKFTQQDAKNTDIWQMLGEAQSQADLLPDAQQSFQKASALAPTEAKYLVSIGQTLVGQHKPDEALTVFQKALEINPKYSAALANMAQVYESQSHLDKAIEAYAKILALDPADYRVIARQVQLYQTLGKTKERDAARDQLFALKNSGKIEGDSYCREQYTQDHSKIIVLEYFELKGPTAVRYAFNVVAADGKSVDKRISLGSYLEATAFAREQGAIKPDERMFHLDLYLPNSHQTLVMLPKEPTYDATRDLVTQYFAGTLKPLPDPAPKPAGAPK